MVWRCLEWRLWDTFCSIRDAISSFFPLSLSWGPRLFSALLSASSISCDGDKPDLTSHPLHFVSACVTTPHRGVFDNVNLGQPPYTLCCTWFGSGLDWCLCLLFSLILILLSCSFQWFGEILSRRFLLLRFPGVDAAAALLFVITGLWVCMFFSSFSTILPHTWSIEKVSLPSFSAGFFLHGIEILSFIYVYPAPSIPLQTCFFLWSVSDSCCLWNSTLRVCSASFACITVCTFFLRGFPRIPPLLLCCLLPSDRLMWMTILIFDYLLPPILLSILLQCVIFFPASLVCSFSALDVLLYSPLLLWVASNWQWYLALPSLVSIPCFTNLVSCHWLDVFVTVMYEGYSRFCRHFKRRVCTSANDVLSKAFDQANCTQETRHLVSASRFWRVFHKLIRTQFAETMQPISFPTKKNLPPLISIHLNFHTNLWNLLPT